jgi:hypothetical protein
MPKTKSKTKFQKFVERSRRREKNKVRRHELYLNNQLDEYGNPKDLLNTSEELLTNEQKLVVRLINKLKDIDSSSLVKFTEDHWHPELINNVIDNYYSHIENKTWIQTFFYNTYKCLGFLNLNNFLNNIITEWINEYRNENAEEISEEYISQLICSSMKGIDSIDNNEIINTMLYLYQTNKTCLLEKKTSMSGGIPLILSLVYLIKVFAVLLITFFGGVWFKTCVIEDAKIRIKRLKYWIKKPFDLDEDKM